ncbi:host attachment family protein [Notoacmeibacter sp. MSK16QG-6]|uniref:host attachment family protein n=1 Tax=Notoacmeibacter sp. MSK16QG-6 TaxID=2957982 RepID=UPI0020A102FA|nr:host attachment family protein [Notoacmeibacter sp. MSK16QG-6]MCP1198868.1 host attachment family protein [Notoacmeibacter sp. MSK16QG-6]
MTKFRMKHGDIVVIADGEKALFLRNEGDATYPNLDVFREMEQDNPPNREQAANRRGRMNDSGANGAQRSAVDDTDWHRLGKERFAREIADRLYKMAHKGKIDRLIVAAPPQVLGDMRKEYHKEVSDLIVGEVDKELANHPIHEIEAILQK